MQTIMLKYKHVSVTVDPYTPLTFHSRPSSYANFLHRIPVLVGTIVIANTILSLLNEYDVTCDTQILVATLVDALIHAIGMSFSESYKPETMNPETKQALAERGLFLQEPKRSLLSVASSFVTAPLAYGLSYELSHLTQFDEPFSADPNNADPQCRARLFWFYNSLFGALQMTIAKNIEKRHNRETNNLMQLLNESLTPRTHTTTTELEGPEDTDRSSLDSFHTALETSVDLEESRLAGAISPDLESGRPTSIHVPSLELPPFQKWLGRTLPILANGGIFALLNASDMTIQIHSDGYHDLPFPFNETLSTMCFIGQIPQLFYAKRHHGQWEHLHRYPAIIDELHKRGVYIDKLDPRIQGHYVRRTLTHNIPSYPLIFLIQAYGDSFKSSIGAGCAGVVSAIMLGAEQAYSRHIESRPEQTTVPHQELRTTQTPGEIELTVQYPGETSREHRSITKP